MNTLFDDMYMKQHLSEYILFQAEQGYALDDIKKALLKFGYKKPIVKEILQHINISQAPKKKAAMYSAHDLDQELKVYVQSLLIDYIIKEHKVGYSLDAIKKALINFGHDPKVIDEAIVIIESGKVVDYRKEASPVKFPQQIVSSLTLFLIFAFLVFLSIATDISIFTILPNFLPAFLAFIIINIVYFFLPKSKLLAALPLFAVILTVGAFIGGIQYGILGTVPGSHVVLILNAVIGFVSTGLVCAFSRKEKDEIVVQIRDKKEKKLHDKEHGLIENKVHDPKLGEPLPREPYHVAGKPHMAHEQKVYAVSHPRVDHPPVEINPSGTMLQFLREEIDKKPKSHQHSLQRPQQAVAVRPKPAMRTHVSSTGHLPEQRKKKEAKIPLKEFE